VLWFQHGHWDAALEQSQLAAKYSDTKRTDDNRRYYAAIAYVHISLLWRMHAEAYPGDAAEANRKAYDATKRALELQPELSMARVEHVANAVRYRGAAGADGSTEARQLIRADARQDKSLLRAYRVNPDLKRFPEVADWV